MTITHNNRSVQTDSRYIAELLQLLIKFGKCHTVGVVGNGTARHYLKRTYAVKRLAYLLGIKTVIRNNAPKGGQLGVYLLDVKRPFELERESQKLYN